MANKIANATAADRRGKWTLQSTMKVVLVGPSYNRKGVTSTYDVEAKTWNSYPRIVDTKLGVGDLWLV